MRSGRLKPGICYVSSAFILHTTGNTLCSTTQPTCCSPGKPGPPSPLLFDLPVVFPPDFFQMHVSCIAWNPSCRSGDGEWILRGPHGCFWHKCQIHRVCLKSEEEEGESVQSPGTTQLQSVVWCAAAASSGVDGAVVYRERSPRRQVMA